jgi:sulfite reductase (ferredoxin)
MTGCPNGCARPYTAEIGIVGQSADLYNVYLRGSALGTRLAAVFRHGVRAQEIAAVLRPLFHEYIATRVPGERFGDWSARKTVEELCQLNLPSAPLSHQGYGRSQIQSRLP